MTDDKGTGPDRERSLNDIMNTGVTAALIGGFALSNLQGIEADSDGNIVTDTV
eukprot:CAMPEP_0119072860 /NCGR_PEP_ID=MMETSP1178-20130426/60412_1 /TAXON_ID=33656 /ORGANISM="unid sp, Strain CCMP2000" /LENGTH=52 /DNA_ID=CAMNT_0007054909 /DNA_START=12 /DNA_END=166 /DNA_ORIENTATION=+